MDIFSSNRTNLIKVFLITVLVSITGCTTDRLIKTKSYDAELEQCWETIKHVNGNRQQLNDSLDREITDYQEIIDEARQELNKIKSKEAKTNASVIIENK